MSNDPDDVDASAPYMRRNRFEGVSKPRSGSICGSRALVGVQGEDWHCSADGPAKCEGDISKSVGGLEPIAEIMA